jgi:hypothetical protein
MTSWLKYLALGLVLGLFAEAQLKLVAGLKPEGFLPAVLLYPVILTAFFGIQKGIDRIVPSRWAGDLLFYGTAGFGGLAIEWTFLGNGPQSNAFQLGMFAMWTCFVFGPRVLSRESPAALRFRKRFWLSVLLAALALTPAILTAGGPIGKTYVAVYGLSGLYIVWSCWLIFAAWRDRRAWNEVLATKA